MSETSTSATNTLKPFQLKSGSLPRGATILTHNALKNPSSQTNTVSND